LSDAPVDVVFVHGLWMTGSESKLLRRRLTEEYTWRTHVFRYQSRSSSMEDIVARLHAFVTDLGSLRTLHFIGHSLGGLVLYRFFEKYPHFAVPGRVVFLGTPSVASKAAVRAARFRPIAAWIGDLVAEELLQPRERRWACARELGIIAGTQRLGLGQFFAGFAEDCDGTIGVSETRLSGAHDHLCVHVSHMGMLVSPAVAREVGLFLRDGRFSLRG